MGFTSKLLKEKVIFPIKLARQGVLCHNVSELGKLSKGTIEVLIGVKEISTWYPSNGKKNKFGNFLLLYSWFTDWRRRTSAVQQRLACSFFHCLMIWPFSGFRTLILNICISLVAHTYLTRDYFFIIFDPKSTAMNLTPNSGGSSRNGGGSGEESEKHLLTHCCKYLINSSSRRNR